MPLEVLGRVANVRVEHFRMWARRHAPLVLPALSARMLRKILNSVPLDTILALAIPPALSAPLVPTQHQIILGVSNAMLATIAPLQLPVRYNAFVPEMGNVWDL